MDNNLILQENIKSKILFIRGKKVILDRDLAVLYEVENRALKQAVKRNITRFPIDFMFILNKEEIEDMVSQNVIPSKSYFGGASPMVFSEQGIAMLSSVLTSERAIMVNIEIMRVFSNLGNLLKSHEDLIKKIDEMEEKYDKKFKIVFDVLKKIMSEEEIPKKQIGFQTK